LSYKSLGIDETGKNMMERYIWLPHGKFLPPFRIDFDGVAYLKDGIEIETISSSLIDNVHFLTIFRVFESWIVFIVKPAPTRRSNNNDTLFDIRE